MANVDAVLKFRRPITRPGSGRHSGAVVAMYSADDPVGGTVALDSEPFSWSSPWNLQM